MATKKKRRTADIRAKKRKRGTRFFLLSLFAVIGIGSLAILFFTLSDFIGTPGSDKGAVGKKRERQGVQLYFSDANERFLVSEKRYIPKGTTPALQAEEIVKALIEGPKTELIRTFPEGTRLLDIQIDQGTALVNFDSNLIDLHPGGSASEIATIYSLTNSLVLNIPVVKRVKILINGKNPATLKGHMDTSSAFTLNKEAIIRNAATEG